MRIEGRKRVAHLAEMIGDPPADVPLGRWPSKKVQVAQPDGSVPVSSKTSRKREPGAGRPSATAREAVFPENPGLFDL
jgi:hypothetical protein